MDRVEVAKTDEQIIHAVLTSKSCLAAFTRATSGIFASAA